ncbi:MAG TPA: pyroglutamyl-peptidase I [Galbitalea sp.]
MTTVLLTGFEPFGRATNNSSWDAVSLVAAGGDDETQLITARLPVTFAGAGSALRDLIAEHSPDVVMAVGLADGRAAITPERVAINVEDARVPDNAGDQPVDRAIVGDGPDAYFTGLPFRAIVDGMRAAGIPASVSNSAGTYVCNSVMYQLMRAVEGSGIAAGFIHVPCSPELAAGTDQPFLEIADIARGIEIAVRVTLADLAGR